MTSLTLAGTDGALAPSPIVQTMRCCDSTPGRLVFDRTLGLKDTRARLDA